MRAAPFLMILALVAGIAGAFTAEADAPATAKATGTISGRVVDSQGKAVKGAEVQAYIEDAAVAPVNRRKHGTVVATAQTAEDGSYKLEAVPAGKVNVAASRTGESGHVPGPVEVVAGKDTKIADIQLEPLLFR